MKDPDMYTTVMSTSSTSNGGAGKGQFITFCAGNCIKCPELSRKVIFANPLPHGVKLLFVQIE